MEHTKVTKTTVTFETEKNQKVVAETDFQTLKVNGKEFSLTAVPSRYGADYWTNSPATKVLSRINGSVVWWLISVAQVYEAIHNNKGGS